MRQHALTHKNRDGNQSSPHSSANNSDTDSKTRETPIVRSKEKSFENLEIDVERGDDEKHEKNDMGENGKRDDAKISDDENSNDDPNRSNISSPSPTGNRKRPTSSKISQSLFRIQLTKV